MKRTLLFTLSLLALCAIVAPFSVSQVPSPAPAHWPWTGVTPAPVPISASAIADSFGNPIANAKLCFSPVDANSNAIGFRVSQVQVMTKPVCALVSNGVLQAGLSLAPTPTGVYYHPQVIDRATGNVLRDYCKTQITGPSWSLDSYDCAAAPGPPPSAGSITPAPTAELAIYCGANPTSVLCGIPYQGLLNTGGSLVTAVAGSGAPSGVVSCDAAHLFIKYYDGTHPGSEYTCLLVSGSYTWQQTAGAGSTGGGGGVQYGTISKYVFIGGSESVVANVRTTPATGAACDGVTCVITDAAAGANYQVGQHVNLIGNVGGDPLWSPSCLNFSIVTVTAVTSGTFSFAEAEGTPGETGCTGAQTGTGGVVQDATNFTPFQACRKPFFTKGGTVTPICKDWAWPGDGVVAENTNYAARLHAESPAVTGAPAMLIIAGGGNDINYGSPAATIESAFQGIWSQAHADGWVIMTNTLGGGPTYNSVMATNNPVYDAVNDWLKGQECTGVPSSPAICTDRIADIGSFAATRSGTFIQSGTFAGHFTDAGANVVANIWNMALATQASLASTGMAGVWANDFSGTQTAPDFALADGSVDFGTTGQGDGFYNFFHFMTNGIPHLQFGWGRPICWNNSAVISFGGGAWGCFNASNLGQGWLAVSSGNGGNPHGWDEDGGLAFQQWAPPGYTSNPSFLRDGQHWYRSDLHQPCYYDNAGTAHCGWSGSAGSMVYPPAGFAHSTGTAWDTPTLAQLMAAFWGDASCATNPYLKKDGTCGNPTGGGGSTNLPGGALGSVPYQSAPGVTAMLAEPTTIGHTYALGWNVTAGAPTVVQSKYCATLPCAFTNPVTAGNLLVFASFDNGMYASVDWPSDSLGSSWNTTRSYLADNFMAVAEGYAVAASSGTDTVSAVGGAPTSGALLLEITGQASSSPIDSAPVITWSRSATTVANSATTTASNELLISWEAFEYGTTDIAVTPSGWTFVNGDGVTSMYHPVNVFSSVSGAPGTYSVTFTDDNAAQARNFAAGIFAIKGAGTAAASAPVPVDVTQALASPLAGTSGSVGGAALTAGQCATGTASIANSTTAMAVAVSPVTYPGAGYTWDGYFSATGTVTVRVCAIAAGTPTASTYIVRVIQ